MDVAAHMGRAGWRYRHCFARLSGDQPVSSRCGPHLQEEAERLRAILEAFPTTEDQDRTTLGNGLVTDWRARTIIDFRIRRKESLRLAIERLEAALAAGESAGGSTESVGAQDSAEEFAESSPSNQESQKASGKKRAAVTPVEDASEDLQDPKFIKIGSAAVDEL